MRDDGLDAHVDHTLGLFRVYETVTVSTTIMAAWRKAGFEYQNRSMTTYFSINERQIHESPDFREIWMFNYHENRPSARRQKQECRWINEKMFRKKERTVFQP
jgi:hypothetical protein